MNKRLLIVLFLSLGLLFPALVLAVKTSDVTGDGKVNSSDVKQVLTNWLSTLRNATDIDDNGKVNSQDLAYVIRDFGKTLPSASPFPSSTSTPSTTEWTQHGFNAQRTGWNTVNLSTNWQYQWLRSDVDMRSQYQVYPTVGNNRVYVPAQSGTVYALNLTNGTNIWTQNLGNLYASVAFDPTTDTVLVPSGNNLYKLTGSSGTVNGTYTAGASLTTSPLIVGNFVYIASDDGKLHKIAISNMQSAGNGWPFNPGTGINQVTMPSYSTRYDVIVYATDPDLKVRAINNSNGSLRWAVKPTVENWYCGSDGEGNACYEFRHNWPVIADNAGIVLMRMRHGYNAMYAFSPMPSTNAAIKQALESNARYQTLFALNLDTGTRMFTPAVKFGAFGNGWLYSGPQPAVRTLPNGKQVAYIIYNNSQVCGGGYCDYRSDQTMGEMVLDNSTVPGYSAGDLRFVKFTSNPSDEAGMVSGSGDAVFHSHWIAVLQGTKITNRSDNLGDTYTNPITGPDTPYVVREQCGNGCNSSTRFCSETCGENGGRWYPAGFYSDGTGWTINPYILVSGKYIIVKSINNTVFVMKDVGTSADSGTQAQIAGTHSVSSNSTPIPNPETIRIEFVHASKHRYQNISTSCQIKYLHQSSRFYYLGCAEPHQDLLQALIPINSLDLFSDIIRTITIGSVINISGQVDDFQGDPVIYVTSPVQIQIQTKS